MSDGKGKILDGMSYQSTLPEEYAKVKHQRDKVVKAFNKLKTLSRQTTEDLLELRTSCSELVEAIYHDTNSRETTLATIEVEKLL